MDMRRRRFMAALAAGGASAGLLPLVRGFGGVARAQSGARRRLVLAYFSGGWDILLGPDARDPGQTYSGIQLGTDLLAAPYRTPVEVNLAGASALWGAPMAALAEHADITTCVRGVNMNTVAHPTGRAYIFTGMPPAGSTARGSSLGTHLVDQSGLGGAPILPQVSIGVPTFNDGLDPAATAVPIANPGDVGVLLQPLPSPVPASLYDTTALEQELKALQASFTDCVDAESYRGVSPGRRYLDAMAQVRELIEDDYAARFDFSLSNPEMNRMRTLYGLGGGGYLPGGGYGAGTDSAMAAAVSAQLLKTDLAQVVSVRLVDGLDTHTQWATDQPPLLQRGFDALAALLTDLRETSDPDGTPLIETTTVMAVSEFGRYPRLNGAQSRDHWFNSAILCFGAGMKPGLYGATGEQDLGILEIDLATGKPQVGGTVLTPEYVYASVLASAGLDPTPYRVDPLDALVKG